MNNKQQMKLYYFEQFGRCEPIRMCLWKANVDYEDVRMGKTSQAWKDMKKSNFLEYG